MKRARALFSPDSLFDEEFLKTAEENDAFMKVNSFLPFHVLASFVFVSFVMLFGYSGVFENLEFIIVEILAVLFYLFSLVRILMHWAKLSTFKSLFYPLGYLLYFPLLASSFLVLSLDAFDFPLLASWPWIRFRHVLCFLLYIPLYWVPYVFSWKRIIGEAAWLSQRKKEAFEEEKNT